MLLSKCKKFKIISFTLIIVLLTAFVFSGCYKSLSQSSSENESESSNSSSISEDLSSGVTGIVMIGPLHPVEQISEVNEEPYPDAIIIIRNKTTGDEIKRSFADKNGRFKIPLSPGDYILDAKNKTGNVFPTSQPMDIKVSPDKFTDIIVNFDTGIR